ncbi:hypothetical protein Apa02nite_010700 [Actinoplanes palleronii]|uniref:Secreted protein n=1 Tax=Actinoplanes palleronii TaxID=113570 RepID=A0ABQ4B313_9ACTN|nr:hypothetical protein Apa02nite_010700 [Actinoplanes palleronii]
MCAGTVGASARAVAPGVCAGSGAGIRPRAVVLAIVVSPRLFRIRHGGRTGPPRRKTQRAIPGPPPQERPVVPGLHGQWEPRLQTGRM